MFTFLKRIKQKINNVVVDDRELCYLCCGNCEEFTPNGEKKGFCPAIYWPYDIANIRKGEWCKDFKIKKVLIKKYRVDILSRSDEETIIQKIERLGRKRRSAMLGDSVMMDSTGFHGP